MTCSSSAEISELIRQIQEGDDEAASELVRLYGAELRREIRSHLRNLRVKAREDSLDVWQSVMKSLFVRIEKKTVPLDARRLSGLLKTMAENKAKSVFRRQFAKKRDVRNTVSLKAIQPDQPGSNETPSEICQNRDFVEQCFRYLDGDDQQLVRLWLAEFTMKEMAAKLNQTYDVIRNRIKRIRRRLKAVMPTAVNLPV